MQRQLYEFAVMSELKNALRSGDVWVLGSRQFKDFDEYLLPARRSLTATRLGTPWVAGPDVGRYVLEERVTCLRGTLDRTAQLAPLASSPDVELTEKGSNSHRWRMRRPKPPMPSSLRSTICFRVSRSPTCCSKSIVGRTSRARSRS